MNEYAQRLEDLAQAGFNKIRELQNNVDSAKAAQAEKARLQNRAGITSLAVATAKAEALAAAAEVARAEEELRQFRFNGLYLFEKQADEIRNEYEEHLADEFVVDSTQVDQNTVMLLNSGILKTNDYVSLYEKAEESGNITMMRVIGSAADKAADIARGNGSIRDTVILHQIAMRSREAAGDKKLKTFDSCVIGFKQYMNNPVLIDNWSIYAEALESL